MSAAGLFLPTDWRVGCSPPFLSYSTDRLWHRPKLVPSFRWRAFDNQSGLAVPQKMCVYNTDGERFLKGEDEYGPDIVEEYRRMVPNQTVAVFWDLDNKPPVSVRPYHAAERLKRLAGEFGQVVDIVAYANQNAFNYVPLRVREERSERRTLDRLEKAGVVKVDQPYICSMCGRKCKTNVLLKKHFKQLHERERNKRMAYVGQLKGKKKMKFLQKVAPKEMKYKEAARTVIVPKVGYGLASDLRLAGVLVRTVEKKPQAADEALVRHITLYINKGIECIFLVSDDSDFREILREAKKKHVCIVVIGDTGTLRGVADASFSWEDVESGKAMLSASGSFEKWANEEALRAELLPDTEFEDDMDSFSHSDDEEEFLEFQRSLRSSQVVSPFADDEEEYFTDEDDEGLDEDENENEGSSQMWGSH